jgi:hypothetical protein
LRVIERRALRREPRDQILYRGVVFPSVADVVDGRSCPHGGNGDFRHPDLIARPIRKARIGASAMPRKASSIATAIATDERVMCRLQARRARNPREGLYARIAPTMNRAVHPPTTASEIHLIWQ